MLMANDYKHPDDCEDPWDKMLAEVLILIHQMFLDEEVDRRNRRRSGNAQRVGIGSKP